MVNQRTLSTNTCILAYCMLDSVIQSLVKMGLSTDLARTLVFENFTAAINSAQQSKDPINDLITRMTPPDSNVDTAIREYCDNEQEAQTAFNFFDTCGAE